MAKRANKKKFSAAEINAAYDEFHQKRNITPLTEEENIRLTLWVRNLISYEEYCSEVSLEEILL